MSEKIYEMKLHEEMEGNGLKILRVPGGWIYVVYVRSGCDVISSTFVPFNNEFMEQDE